MADLTDSIPSNKKIQELQKELDHLKNYVSGPKFLYDQTSKVYAADAGAYYDPTLSDKKTRILYLEDRIAYLNGQMQKKNKPVVAEVKSIKIGVQNFTNKNKEETNAFIGRSYYYPVRKIDPPSVSEKDNTYGPKYVDEFNIKNDGPKHRVQEVSKKELIQQKEATAANFNPKIKEENKKVDEKFNKYKTVASTASANKPKPGYNSADAKPEKVKPTQRTKENVSPSAASRTSKDDYFFPSSAPRDPPIANPKQPYPTTIQTEWVNKDRKSSNSKDIKPKAEEKKETEKPKEKKDEKKEVPNKPIEKKKEKKEVSKPVKKKEEKKESPKPVERKEEKKMEVNKPVEKPIDKKEEKKEIPKPVERKTEVNKVEVAKSCKKKEEKKEIPIPNEKKVEVKKEVEQPKRVENTPKPTEKKVEEKKAEQPKKEEKPKTEEKKQEIKKVEPTNPRFYETIKTTIVKPQENQKTNNKNPYYETIRLDKRLFI